MCWLVMGYIIFSRVTNVIFGKFSCCIRSVPTIIMKLARIFYHGKPGNVYVSPKTDHSRLQYCWFWNAVRSKLTETARGVRLQRQQQRWTEQWLCAFILHGNLVPRAFVTLISFRGTRVTGRLWERDCVHYPAFANCSRVIICCFSVLTF